MPTDRQQIMNALDRITRCDGTPGPAVHIGEAVVRGDAGARVQSQARLMVVLEGEHRVQVCLGGKTQDLVLRPGERLLLVPHGWFVPDYSTDYRLFGMVFFPDRLRFLINEHDARLGHRPPRIWHHVPVSAKAPVTRVLDATLAAARDGVDNGAIDALFQALLLLARACLDHPVPRPTTGHAVATFDAVLDYLQANCGDALDRNVVAQVFGLHPGHVSRLFRQHAQTGFNETLNRLRLEKAVERLRESQWSVADIAAACGYGSSVNFIRRFRREYGTTPADYRLNHKS